jgi:hypothetical protein
MRSPQLTAQSEFRTCSMRSEGFGSQYLISRRVLGSVGSGKSDDLESAFTCFQL